MWIRALTGELINLSLCTYILYDKEHDITIVKAASPKLLSDWYPVAKGDKRIDISMRLASSGAYLDFTK